jgi:hypothetical protein
MTQTAALRTAADKFDAVDTSGELDAEAVAHLTDAVADLKLFFAELEAHLLAKRAAPERE